MHKVTEDASGDGEEIYNKVCLEFFFTFCVLLFI